MERQSDFSKLPALRRLPLVPVRPILRLLRPECCWRANASGQIHFPLPVGANRRAFSCLERVAGNANRMMLVSKSGFPGSLSLARFQVSKANAPFQANLPLRLHEIGLPRWMSYARRGDQRPSVDVAAAPRFATMAPKLPLQTCYGSCRRSSVDVPTATPHSTEVPSLSRAFGQVVRKHRQRIGLSQEELADRAGIHRTYVSAIERGKVRLGLDAARRVADGLGVPLSILVAEAEPARHPPAREDLSGPID